MLQIFHKKTGQRGFTLIELLVVIAIIGILATIVLVSLNSARSKSRNARRVSDLRQIQLGEEIYYDGIGTYAGALATLVSGNAISAVPKDPSSNMDYAYCSSGSSYVVGTKLEPPQTAGTGLMATSISLTKAGGICALAGGNPSVASSQCGTVDTGANAYGYYCVAP